VTPYLAQLAEEVSHANFFQFSTEEDKEFYSRYTEASISSLYTQSIATGRSKAIREMTVINLLAFSV
jgi:hypothetical protein